MSQQSRSYKITPDKLTALREALAQKGIVLPDTPSGSVAGPSGFTIGYGYVEPTLTIVLDGSGWKMPLAWMKLENAIEPFE